MKKIFTYFLVSIVFVQTLHQSLLVSLYQYDRDFVVNNFCENKQDDTCNGKCFLEKQSQDIEDWENKIPKNLKDFSVLFYYLPFTNVFEPIQMVSYIVVEKNGFYHSKNPISSPKDIFHPPLFS